MIARLVWRNLWRNRRRTLITMASVTFAVLLAVVMQSLQKGTFGNLIRNVVRFHSGYIQVHAKGYWDERVIENSFGLEASLLTGIRRNAHVRTVVPRLETYALASTGEKTKGCMVNGISPSTEDSLTRLSGRVYKGCYLENGSHGVLVAEGLAGRLGIGLNDTLVLLGQGFQGSTAAGRYKVEALLRFNSPTLNESMVYMTLPDAQSFLSAEGRVTTLALDVTDPDRLEEVAMELSESTGPHYEVMSWKEMMPEVENHIRSDAVSLFIWMGILYLIIAFGIFSTLLMMVAERRYELGMLVAIGMRRRRLAGMLFMETILITLSGVLVGVVLAVPVVWYMREHPLRIGGEGGRAFAKWGFEPILPTMLDPKTFMLQSGIVMCIALLIGTYPAWKAMRTDPVRAMKK
jgi:ABC-type lipoprotein release transport system permease subunit